MRFSIAICTRNRAVSLKRALDSILLCRLPKNEQWEILVVDNGSTDDTQSVIQKYKLLLPIVSIVEENAGLSHARNAAVAFARGEYIIWTDDDVTVDALWIDAYLEAFKRYPDSAIFGGKIVPFLEQPSPDWFAENLSFLGLLTATRDFGANDVALNLYRNIVPFGANYAVKTDAQRRFLYDPNLGVAPGRRGGGEEVAVISFMLKQGCTGYWLANATVYHQISLQRQTLTYLNYYYYSHGFACFQKQSLTPISTPQGLKVRICVSAKLAAAIMLYAIVRFISPRKRIRLLTTVSFYKGACSAFYPSLTERHN